jgi:hypothetical protein
VIEDNDLKLACFIVVVFLAAMHKCVSLVVSSDDGVLNDICGSKEIKQRRLLFVDFTDVTSVSLSNQILKNFTVTVQENTSSAFFGTSLASCHSFKFNEELSKQNCTF